MLERFPALLIEGRLLETILKAERGVASCGGGSQPLAPGGPGSRPPGTTTWLRGARCTDPEAMPETEARPRVKNRHGGAPRGERPALWDARRLARRLACRVMCTPNGCRCTRTTLGAPPTPRFGVREAKSQTPDAKTRRGNEMGCLTS